MNQRDGTPIITEVFLSAGMRLLNKISFLLRGLFLNGLFSNRVFLNGLFSNRIFLNGVFLNGVFLRGLFLSVILLSGLVAVSCTKTVYVEKPIEPDKRPIVYFVSKEGSLGDFGYVDSIYRGVVRGTSECGMMLSLLNLPPEESSMELVLGELLEYLPEVGRERRVLVVIANDHLEPVLHKYDELLSGTSGVDCLLTESSDLTLPVHSIRLPQYGVCYQAGRVAGRWIENLSDVLVVSANSGEEALGEMSGGFIAGLKAGDQDISVEEKLLSDTDGGYDMADDAYRMCYDIDGKYGLVLPLCGGTCQGFYRYNRENPSRFWTLGVDCDMQRYSPDVPFSVVKHMDRVMQKWISRWGDGEEMPRHLSLGLASGYTGIVVADAYQNEGISALAESYYAEALKREEEYEDR